ncbi:uncharacterized protein B0I36DRAFT_99010 [Microdochium trichocladiopsis]|uniref:Uncharacterized protein n=1 Tax=Microdochium trichocladiopsis TaxID=1682393 RepID=A0A9P8Y8P5_9PEZI|nr:uncharacterized protein B0I36DRAFT_99010 [Microdochium trichocladiopsis]KAH7032596.1 hypothetical protein B0I36DRAFT_99010 [Microdochium trichocladiopsis]
MGPTRTPEPREKNIVILPWLLGAQMLATHNACGWLWRMKPSLKESCCWLSGWDACAGLAGRVPRRFSARRHLRGISTLSQGKPLAPKNRALEHIVLENVRGPTATAERLREDLHGCADLVAVYEMIYSLRLRIERGSEGSLERVVDEIWRGTVW